MPVIDAGRPRLAPQRRSAVSRAQVETVSSRAVGLFGLAFGAQTVPIAIDQSNALAPGAGVVLMIVVYGSIVILAIASVLKVAVRAACLVVAGVYVVALAAWPMLVVAPTALDAATPWLYYLCNVATTAAVVAVSVPWATAYTIAVPAGYGFIRLLPAGGEVGALLAFLDAMYAVILGTVVLIIITMLRQAAEGVDTAQEAALERYDVVARLHARELERAKIDALVHDSVLTTLLSAASASTPKQQALAARMAVEAVDRIDEAGAGGQRSDDRMALAGLVRRLRTVLGTYSAPFSVRAVNARDVDLPVEAVDALYAAAMQAIVNSVQHADEPGHATRREVRIRGVRASGVVIEVADDGRGFDVHEVGDARLGIRVSIRERMANAGGRATVESRPGHGTTVTLTWPEPGRST